MGHFPCERSFGDIIKFKYRGHGIVEGQIVGVIIGGTLDNYYIDYRVHSLPGKKPRFYFKSVAEHNIIKE